MIGTTIRPILSITNLAVRRSEEFCLYVPNLSVLQGQVTCIVGANGSGKTTLLETIVGLAVPREGRVSLRGHDLAAASSYHPLAKRLLGYVPDDESWIIAELTAREYFALLRSTYDKAGVTHNMRQMADDLAAVLGFTQFNQQLGSLSHGNIKKVQLIAGMMHRPSLLVVDELRNGLDPIAIKQAESLLAGAKKRGAAVIASTHDLWWAQRVADRIIMLQNGRVVLAESARQIVATSGSVEAKFMALQGVAQ